MHHMVLRHSSSLCLVLADKADDIPGPVTHEIGNAEPPYVLIKWNAPSSPNGLIVLYEVFYSKVGETEVSIRPTLSLPAAATAAALTKGHSQESVKPAAGETGGSFRGAASWCKSMD